MHIAMYSPAWPASEHSNGIITYVGHMRDELTRQGHRVSVFTGNISEGHRCEGIHLVRSQPTLWQRLRRKWKRVISREMATTPRWGHVIAGKMLEVHLADPIDVIEIEESFGWCADLQAGISVPVVVKLHGPAFLDLLEEKHGQSGQQKIADEGLALRQMRYVISPSSTTLDETLRYYELTPALAATVPNPMAPAPADDHWRLATCEGKTLIFVGRFDHRKGGDLVLRVFHLLLKMAPALKLIFIGPDRGIPGEDGKPIHLNDFVASLFQPAEQSRIEYLGRQAPTAIPSMRRRALVTLIASRWDNQPNTALEAMMQGCPIVAIDTGGVGELIEHQVSGLLARSDDMDDLCQQILYMLDHPQHAAEMGKAGQIAAQARHDLKTLVDQTIGIYRQAIADHSGTSLRGRQGKSLR